VKVFLKKYGAQGSRLAEQQAARDRLSLPKLVPPAPEPVFVPPPKGQAPAAEAAPEAVGVGAAAEGAGEGGGESTT
jgi:hypothetical protein